MAELKTKQHDGCVVDFINGLENQTRRKDCETMSVIMSDITQQQAKLWGSNIVGFGSYDYVYNSGHSGTSLLTGFAPRKQAFTIYIMSGFAHFEKELQNLGKFKLGKSCLYCQSVDDLELDVLKKIIAGSVKWMREKYPNE